MRSALNGPALDPTPLTPPISAEQAQNYVDYSSNLLRDASSLNANFMSLSDIISGAGGSFLLKPFSGFSTSAGDSARIDDNNPVYTLLLNCIFDLPAFFVVS